MHIGRAAEAGVEQPLEDEKRIAVGDVQPRTQQMNLSSFGKHAIARVLDLRGKLSECCGTKFMYFWIAERHQSRLQVLGRNPAAGGVIDQAAGQIALADRRARPIDHLRGKDATTAQLLAKAG